MDDKEKDAGPRLKILLADDAETNAALVAKLMEKRGHDITTVENGLEAFEAFQKDNFDAILMDIHMPVMDGLESAKKIREYESSNPSKLPTPIIAMTANNDPGDHENYLKNGVNGVIEKSIQTKIVVSQIREIIEKFSAQS